MHSGEHRHSNWKAIKVDRWDWSAVLLALGKIAGLTLWTDQAGMQRLQALPSVLICVYKCLDYEMKNALEDVLICLNALCH